MTVLSHKAKRPVRPIVSRGMVLLFAAAVIVPWIVIASLLAMRNPASGNSTSPPAVDAANPVPDSTQTAAPASTASASGTAPAGPPPQEWTRGKKGPWGQIESLLFAIDLPDEFAFVPPANQPPIRWSFPGYSKEKVLATLRSVGLPEDAVKSLDASPKWSMSDGVASVEPGDPLILSLAPEVRSKLYALLVTFPQNGSQIDPVWFQDGLLDWRLQDSGLAPESLSLLKRLLYPQGDKKHLFADFEPATRCLPSDAERKHFMKAVSRKRAVLARLRLDPDADVEKIAQYWGIAGRRKDVLPLLEALHRVERDCTLNVVCLLPSFARDRLYRYPFAAPDANGVKEDCYWSAFNFFNNTPDNRINDFSYMGEVLRRDYYRIEGPSQLGDLIFLAVGAEKNAIHVAAYVADDLVFTKNGEDLRQPWMLMHMADMIESYAVKYPNGGTLDRQFFRKKSL